MFLDDDGFSSDVSSNAEELVVGSAGTFLPHLGKPLHECMRNSVANYMPFTKKHRTAIKLLIRLRKRNGSLDTCEDVMELHFLENGQMDERQSLAQCADHISRVKVQSSSGFGTTLARNPTE